MTSDSPEPSTIEPERAPIEPERVPADTSVVVAALQGLPNRTDYNAIVTWGKLMAESGFFKDAKTAAQAAVKILYGTEMGFSIGASMAGVHVIEGRPTLAAHLQAQKVKTSGRYDYEIAVLTEETCTIHWLRRTEDGRMTKFGETTFTTEDARRANLFGRSAQNWEKYPRNMLFARALTNGIRFYCPDIFTSGPVYTPDELADVALTESGDLAVIDAAVVNPNPLGDEARAERNPERAASSQATAEPERRRNRGQPERPDQIEDIGGLLWWARNFLGARQLPNDTRHILDMFGVAAPGALREKFNGDFEKAALVLQRAALGDEALPPPDNTPVGLEALTPEQRSIYDSVIAAGSSHEDAMLLARDEGDDLSEGGPDGDDDDEDTANDASDSQTAGAEPTVPDGPAPAGETA